jgi:glucoamylase
MKVLANTFCNEYSINQKHTKEGTPGILIGRYPGDSYAGGNPWQLLTAVYAKTFYQGASVLMESNGFLKEEDRQAWFDILKLPADASLSQQIQSAIKAGDSVMNVLYSHVKGDGGHIAEQIDRNSGVQKSANDLTWSYANILSAMQARAKATEAFSTFVEATQA